MNYDHLPNDLREILPRAEAFYRFITEPMNLEHNDIDPGEAVITICPLFAWEPVVSKFVRYVTGKWEERYFETPFRIILKKPRDSTKAKESMVIQTPKNCRPWNGLMPTLADTVMAGIDNVEETLVRMRDYDVYADIIAKEFEKVSSSVR